MGGSSSWPGHGLDVTAKVEQRLAASLHLPLVIVDGYVTALMHRYNYMLLQSR